jgi:hypothetical protein
MRRFISRKIRNVWDWLAREENHNAFDSIAAIAAVLTLIAASALAFQQNTINKRLLHLEELSHVPILTVTIQSVKLQKPKDKTDSWSVYTKFSLANAGTVPLQILAYHAGEIAEESGKRFTESRQQENLYFNKYSPDETSNLIEMLPAGLSKSLEWTNGTYKQQPNAYLIYKLRVFFREYPNGVVNCLEVHYTKDDTKESSGFYQFEFACRE